MITGMDTVFLVTSGLHCSYRMSLAAPVAERASLPGSIPTSERGLAVEPAKLVRTGSGKAGESADRTRDQSHDRQR